MQHSDDRLTPDPPNGSKMIWSTMTNPTPFLAFGNSFKLSTPDTGNDVEKSPVKLALLNLLETSPNPSPTNPSQTTSPAKVLCPNRRIPALLRAPLPRPRNPLPTFR